VGRGKGGEEDLEDASTNISDNHGVSKPIRWGSRKGVGARRKGAIPRNYHEITHLNERKGIRNHHLGRNRESFGK